MSKKALKKKVVAGMSDAEMVELMKRTGQTEEQLLAQFLSMLLDGHRDKPRTENGTYELSNTVVMDPVDHMKLHGTYRERTVELEALKTLADDRMQVLHLKNKIASQLMAYDRRTDHGNPETKGRLLLQLKQVDKWFDELTKRLEKMVKGMVDPLVEAALGVRGVGPITVAYCLVYLDLGGYFPALTWDKKPHPRAGQEKCPHASSLWKYVGLDKSSHERYEKGKAGGGNKTLRTILYTMADSQIKCDGAYRHIYDQVKARLEKSTVMVETCMPNGKWETRMWKDVSPGHRDGAAKRAVIKHFLADYWYVGRTLMGRSTSSVWVVVHGNGSGHRMIMPESRGWKYKKSDDQKVA